MPSDARRVLCGPQKRCGPLDGRRRMGYSIYSRDLLSIATHLFGDQTARNGPGGWAGRPREPSHVRTLTFLKSFFTSPRQTGAIAPSSVELAEAVVGAAKISQASVVVEFGPGTGVITKKVMEVLPPTAIFFAMEINPVFVEIIRTNYPGVTVFNDSAANTPKYLSQMGALACDAVVSGLPWASFSDDLQDSILDVIQDVLRPDGRFVSYAYLMSPIIPAGIRFRQQLRARFTDVTTTPMVWKNLPPAFVYRAEKPV